MPGNPYVTGFPWSAATNYAAGPDTWDGTPTKAAPAYVTFQPKVANAPTAQEFNYLQNQRDQALLWTNGRVDFVDTFVGPFGAAEDFTNDTGSLNDQAWTGSAYVAGNTYDIVTIATAAADVVLATLSGTVGFIKDGSSATSVHMGVSLAFNEGSGFTTAGCMEVARAVTVPTTAAAEVQFFPVTLIAKRVVTTGGALHIGINGRASAQAGSFAHIGFVSLSVHLRQIRPY